MTFQVLKNQGIFLNYRGYIWWAIHTFMTRAKKKSIPSRYLSVNCCLSWWVSLSCVYLMMFNNQICNRKKWSGMESHFYRTNIWADVWKWAMVWNTKQNTDVHEYGQKGKVAINPGWPRNVAVLPVTGQRKNKCATHLKEGQNDSDVLQDIYFFLL